MVLEYDIDFGNVVEIKKLKKIQTFYATHLSEVTEVLSTNYTTLAF